MSTPNGRDGGETESFTIDLSGSLMDRMADLSQLDLTDKERDQHFLELADIATKGQTIPDWETSVRNSVAASLKSLVFAQDDVYALRMTECRKCEFSQEFALGGARKLIQCGKCKCLMDVKAKFVPTKCPVGRF